MTKAIKALKLVKRVVVGVKAFYGINHKTGERIIAKPGDTVEVYPDQAASMSHILVDAKVVAAKAAIAQAEAEAEAEEAEAPELDSPQETGEDPEPKDGAEGDDGPGSG